MQFAFRLIEPADEPFLWEMLYHALYVPEGFAPLAREIVREPAIAQYVSGWGRTGDSGLIVEKLDDACQLNQPVGAVWLRQFTAAQPAYGFIDDATPELSIALLPGYRDQGLGTQLLEKLLETVRDTHSALSLSVSRDNPARRLYERFGFEVVGESGDSLTMKKSLVAYGSLV